MGGYSRELLIIEMDTSLPGQRLVQVLEQVTMRYGLPRRIVIDNGSEFVGKALDQWSHERSVELHFITPGLSMENDIIERFDGRFRGERLNQHWIRDLDDAHQKIERRYDYNHDRIHSSLSNHPPHGVRGTLWNTPRRKQNGAVADARSSQ